MKQTPLAALVGMALSSAYASAATLTSGHVDFIGIGYVDGELEPHSHAHEGAVVDNGALIEDTEYELGELTVQTTTTILRAAGSEWDPVGVAAGQSFWLFTETETPGQPFIGIGAEELTATDWTTPITITLTGMTGPSGGQFSLWQTDGLGVPTFFMSTLNGISGVDAFSMDLNEDLHAHFGWGFTAEGTYDLTFEISGTHIDGEKTATATYSFSVIPEPSSALLGAIGALALLRRRRN
jgi:surface-anchored protein